MVIDRAMRENPDARVACEVLATQDLVVIAGEVDGIELKGKSIAKEVKDYLSELDYETHQLKVNTSFHRQSKEIREYSLTERLKSGDQCVAVGYASFETPEFLPLATAVAQEISHRLTFLARFTRRGEVRFDHKVLVVLDKVKKIVKELVVSFQHAQIADLEPLKRAVLREAVTPVLFDYKLEYEKGLDARINQGISFLKGGLNADSGVTNRKIISDTYGLATTHGGGGLHGKDLSKIDRLLAYYLRWIAVNLVSSGICREIELEATAVCGANKPKIRIKKIDSDYPEPVVFECIEVVFNRHYDFQMIYEQFRPSKS